MTEPDVPLDRNLERNDNARMMGDRDVRRIAGLACAAALFCALPGPQVFAQGCAMCGTALGNADDPLARSMASRSGLR